MKNKTNATEKDKPNKKTVIKTVKMCALIFAGCILYSIGVALFLDPSELASGGATGISIMINYVIKKYTGFDFGTGDPSKDLAMVWRRDASAPIPETLQCSYYKKK